MENLIKKYLEKKDYEVLCRELHNIPPPQDGPYSILGIRLWLLTSPMRSWTELGWGLYRSCLDNALKEARDEIIIAEGT